MDRMKSERPQHSSKIAQALRTSSIVSHLEALRVQSLRLAWSIEEFMYCNTMLMPAASNVNSECMRMFKHEVRRQLYEKAT